MGDLRREPHVGESLVEALGVVDGRAEAPAAATARAGEPVDVESAPHQVGPERRAPSRYFPEVLRPDKN